MKYNISSDLKLIRGMLNKSQLEMASSLNISKLTVSHIENNQIYPNDETLSDIYNFAYKKKIKLNYIKEMLCKEEHSNEKVIFHGAKTQIEGEISPLIGKSNNDFGQGFYCGENYRQALSFVAKYPTSSLYMIVFNDKGLKKLEFDVNQEWMLAIAYYRGTIDKYKDRPLIKNIIKKVKNSDYVYAPIADNRMFVIIDQFIDGLITDEQCKHCLAATDLGKQYVFLNKKATSKLQIIERMYVCKLEKEDSLKTKDDNVNDGDNKVKAALIKYKGKGKYIEEILNETN